VTIGDRVMRRLVDRVEIDDAPQPATCCSHLTTAGSSRLHQGRQLDDLIAELSQIVPV
jgi:hypothetical protein